MEIKYKNTGECNLEDMLENYNNRYTLRYQQNTKRYSVSRVSYIS